MKWKFEKEFRADHPETIGETDREFDIDNYKDWLEQKLVKLFAIQDVSQRSELLAIAALDKIAHPIKHLQEEAEKDGCKLDGYMAIQLTQDANFYQEIADKALKAIANCG